MSSKKWWSLHLDFDAMDYEEVVQDCERLKKEYPKLGEYKIESSQQPRHFHVKFPKSKFASFDEAYQIALESKADRDWLPLCQEYQTFGLNTEVARRYNEIRQQREKQRVVNKPTKMILSPFILDLEPATPLDGRRIVKVCEAIDDPEWHYNAFVHVWDLKQHVQIGCRDEQQANRRMKWLSEQGLNFTATVKKNPQV